MMRVGGPAQAVRSIRNPGPWGALMKMTGWMGLALLGLCAPMAADAEHGGSDWYGGVRGGLVLSGIDSDSMTREMQRRGHNVAVEVDDDAVGGHLYVGRQFTDKASVEIGFMELGSYDARVTGTTTQPAQLASDISDAQPVSGEAISLGLRARIPVSERVGLDTRLGGFYWSTDSDIRTAAGTQQIEDDGIGTLFGMGLDARLGARLHLGLGAELWRPDSEGASRVVYGQIEYHFGH